MNERIKELEAQCWEYRDGYEGGNGWYTVFNRQKFAELIIGECISLFDGTREMKTIGMLTHPQVVEQIKKHFGVEK